MTTLEDAVSVSDEQIESLLTEAGTVGDEGQVALCLVALGREDGRVQAQRRWLESRGFVPGHVDAAARARAECARAIRAGQG